MAVTRTPTYALKAIPGLVPEQSTQYQDRNPSVRMFGYGPAGATCAGCRSCMKSTFTEQKRNGKNHTYPVFLCDHREEAGFPRSFNLGDYTACARFVPIARRPAR